MKKERKREERRVASLGETLAKYKREIGNCQTAAREMGEEGARLDALHTRYLEIAEEADRKASMAEAEAARLEWEAGSAEDGPYKNS